MTPALIREFQQIQRYASRLSELLAQAKEQAPRRAEGTDRSGMVRVMLGPDGLPETIKVENGWKGQLAPDAFGAAVGEAFSAATGNRLTAWTVALREQGWPARVDRLRTGLDSSGPEPAPVPPAVQRAMPPRPLDAIAEDVIKAFDTVHRFAAPPAPVSGSGSAASGRLSLTLSASGGLSCTADPKWVSRQSAAALRTALSVGLRAARAELARANLARAADDASGTARLDGLLNEAFAVLMNPSTASNAS